LHDRGAVSYLHELGSSQVALGYAVNRHATPDVPLVYDVSLAIARNMLRAICAPCWKPTRVTFAHYRPADTGPYRNFFKAPLRFDATRSEIQFDAQWLSAKIASSDAAVHAAVQRAADASEDVGSFAEGTRSTVRALAMTQVPSAQRVAQLLSVHERALRRYLRADGATGRACRPS
jgi:hypothetical protein